jgi:MYXO-CTERM domain-containing protein
VCVADLGICGCAGPADDRSCGAADSGLICSGAGGFCVPGCGPEPRNGCPTGQNCLDIVNGVGQCSGAMCHSSADCKQPLPHCDLGGGTDGRCVQCLFDTDCDAPLVCDGVKKKCLECTPTNTTQCRPELAGSQCLVDGRCGCTTDADCGGVASGRVCDAAAARCIPGCRGAGGNGCPSEHVCSSANEDIGRCDRLPPSDGGADGGGDGGGAADGAAPDGGGTDAADASADVADAGAPDTGGSDARDAGSMDVTPSPDAARPDAGTGDGPDAGDSAPDRFIAGGGCHCGVAGGDTGAPWATLLAILAAVAAALGARRRRR